MTTTHVNITVDKQLYQEAKELKINISGAAAKGIATAIDREKKMREIESPK